MTMLRGLQLISLYGCQLQKSAVDAMICLYIKLKISYNFCSLGQLQQLLLISLLSNARLSIKCNLGVTNLEEGGRLALSLFCCYIIRRRMVGGWII